MTQLDTIIKQHAKVLTESLKELYIQSYIKGAKDAATRESKESIYDEAVMYFNEQGEWIEDNFIDVDSKILHAKLDAAIIEGQSFGQFWESTKDSGMFDRARAERIFRTETNRAYSEGTLRQYRKEGVKKVNILLGPSPCPVCIDLATSGPHLVKDVEGLLPVHPNSIVNGTSPIYTTTGYKPIKDIKVGNEVLTIDGTFKKVIAISQVPAPTNESITLSLGKFGHTRQRRLSLTPEHKVWTKRGWIEAKNLTTDDYVLQYLKHCSICNKLHPVWQNYCSHDCQLIANEDNLKRVGKHELENISAKDRAKYNRKLNKRLKAEGRLGFQNKHVQDKAQKTLKPRKAEIARKARKTLAANRTYETWIEKRVRLYLEKIKTNFKQEYHVSKGKKYFFLDFAIPEHKIDIECDGQYWHNKEDDDKRDKILTSLGWTVLRLSGKDINSNFSFCTRQIDNILTNHSGKFVSKWLKLERITHNRVPIVKTLYDLTVEDNETFVINSIVVHNCSCVFVNAEYSEIPQR